MVLVKTGYSQSQIGYFETLTFVAGALSFFWITGIIQALLPKFDTSRPQSAAFWSTFILLTGFALASGIVLLLSARWTSGLLHLDEQPHLVWLVAAYIFFNAPASLLEYLYLLKKQATKLVRYGWMAFGLQLLAISLTALWQLPFIWIMIALIATALLRWVWTIAELRKDASFQVDVRFIQSNLSLGGPVMLSVLLSGSAQYIDGLIVTGYFDESVFAVFRYGARELPLVALLAHALSNAMVPAIREHGPAAGLRQLKERSGRMAGWMFPLTLVMILISPVIFPLLYNTEYAGSADVFAIYLLLVISRLLFPQSILLAYEKTRILMYISFLELVMNVGLSLIFIQLWGIQGVAWATVAAYFFERLALMIYVRVNLGFPPAQYVDLKKHLLWTAAVLVAYIFSSQLLAEPMKQLFL